MKYFPFIVHPTLIVTIPTFAAHPMRETPAIEVREFSNSPIQVPDPQTLSYDEAVQLLAQIESGTFDRRMEQNELDQVNKLISFLATEGAAENEKADIAAAAASLFRNDDVQYALYTDLDFGYAAIPAIYVEGARDVVHCKNWYKKQWRATREFVKKHKKAIIIGAIIVVTVAVVVVAAVAISTSAASSAAAAGLALAGGVAEASQWESEQKSFPQPSLVSSLQEQVSSFKETTAREQFAAVSESNGISLEQNGRIIGSLFAHKTVESLSEYSSRNPLIAAELRDFGWNSQSPIPSWQPPCSGSLPVVPHHSADCAFSTDYGVTYAGNFGNLDAVSYQARGDLALSSEYYQQAVQDFSKAISRNPSNPILYLEKGIANFELGNFADSIADYSQYVEKKGEPFCVTDFSLGFAKGVPKGVYESGKGALLFLSDFIAHPVQTSKQVVDSLNQLATLVKNDEFGVIAETLSPELHQLVTQWDTLSSDIRGELAGYAVGKLGTDLIAPGAVAKVASKCVKSAQELAAICKNMQIAQETLVLETASGIGIPAKVSEIVTMGKKTTALGEELGLSSQEMAQLQKAGKLEAAVSNACEYLSPQGKASFELFQRAQEFLKPYKGYMPESQARELIHQTGIRTFPRPAGIPENYRVKLSNNGAGIKYVHPTDEGHI